MKQINEIVKERLKYPASDEMDANMKRLKYVRYADDFLIGIMHIDIGFQTGTQSAVVVLIQLHGKGDDAIL